MRSVKSRGGLVGAGVLFAAGQLATAAVAGSAADSPPVAWGSGIRIPYDTAGTFSCPPISPPVFAVVGDSIWDLRKGEQQPQKLNGIPEARLPSAVSADGTLFASVAGVDNVFEKDAAKRLAAGSITVWSVSTGQSTNSLKAETIQRRPTFLAFSGPNPKSLDKWLIAVGPNDRPREGDDTSMHRVDVWDLATSKVHHSFLIVPPAGNVMTISLDGGYLAVIGGDHVYVYSIRTGRQDAVMKDPPADLLAKTDKTKKPASLDAQGNAAHRAPAINPSRLPRFSEYSWDGGLAFSPNGRELAGVFSGRMMHKANRLFIWDSSGHVTFDSAGHQLGGDFGISSDEGLYRDVQWSPDGTQLLVAGGWLIDRKTAATVWHVPLKLFERQQPIFLDNQHVLVPRKDAWESCEIPQADIKASLAAYSDPKVQAAFRPDRDVSIAIDLTGNLRGDAGQARDALTKAIIAGLTSASLTVADNQPAVFHISYEESAGRTAEVYESRFINPFGGKDTGQKATGTDLKATVELKINGSPDAVWSQQLNAYSPQSMAGPVNDDTLRTAALNDLCWQLNRLVVPTFVPADPSIKSLPIVAE